MSNKYPNVIIFLVDSARYYSTGGLDDRDKLEMMDKFEKESIYFPTAVSAAPTSLMSASALLTSLPAYYIARNYDDFKYDDKLFISLPRLLESEGYEIKSVMNALETREKFDTLLPHVGKKYWAEGIRHDQIQWPNDKVSDVLENYLSARTSTKPLFLFVWYNIRLDPTTSHEVERGIKALKESAIWENSFFVLGSDHGYMDPRRGFSPEKLKAMGLSHGLVMSEDSIRIPLYMRFPNSPVTQVDVPVSTMDIMPTVLDFLGITYPEDAPMEMHGLSLLPLFKDNEAIPEKFLERKIRCDARYFAQTDRSTIIRGKRYKYLIRPDQNIEEFYDLEQRDKEWEDDNQISDPTLQHLVEEFRQAYQRTEDEAIQFQTRFMVGKLRETVKKALQKSTGRVVVVGLAQPYYLDVVSEILPDVFDDSSLDLVVDEQVASRMQRQTVYQQVFAYKIGEDGRLNGADMSKLSEQSYSVKLILGDSRNEKVYHVHRKMLNSLIKATFELNIDSNMQPVTRDAAKSSLRLLFRAVYAKRSYYLQNPQILIRHFLMGAKNLIRKALGDK